jgi:hypothetical protein
MQIAYRRQPLLEPLVCRFLLSDHKRILVPESSNTATPKEY